jgi:hypothetical protein
MTTLNIVHPFEKIEIDFCKELKRSFIAYAGSFRKAGNTVYNQHMELKQYHTARVCEEITSLGRSIGMDQQELAFAEVIAWLHDIGRFEQFDRYGTFADAQSENHSEIALRLIDSMQLLRGLTGKQVNIIKTAILNHNLPVIPEDQTPAINFYSRMLRDADKLDIWWVAIENNIFHTIRDEAFPVYYAVPDTLWYYFDRKKIIPLNEINSYYDSILFRLSWVFDLNFDYSLIEFKKRDIAGRLLEKLPVSDRILEIKSRLEQFSFAPVLEP